MSFLALISIILTIIGAVALFFVGVEVLWSPFEFITSHLMPYFLPAEVQPLLKRFGPWAAVTGSTDGIGKEYSKELARRGFNVVLISRSPEKLRQVASEIEKAYPVKTKIIVADFSKGAEVYPHIEKELKDIQLGLLVNNVGISYEYPTVLCEVPLSLIWDLINVNIVPVTVLTRMLLPGMVERGRGAVVNVSSGAERQPIPLQAVYAASKAYVKNFTLAIHEEYASKGITIQHLSPFFVSTKINSFSKRLLEGNVMVPDAEAYARQAVATLGRVHSSTGYWIHGIQGFFVSLAPTWLRIKISTVMFNSFREEYLHNSKVN